MEQQESVAEFDPLVQKLYGLAVFHEWQDFRLMALGEAARGVGAIAAAWLTRSSGNATGEFTRYPAELKIERSALAHREIAAGTEPATIDPVPGDLRVPGESTASSAYIQRYEHRQSGLSSVVVLYFAAGVKPPPTLPRIVAHLVEAGSLSLHQYIQRDEWLVALGRTNRGTSSIVDAKGIVYAAAPRFRELVAENGDRQFTTLPFEMPAGVEDGVDSFFAGPLHFRVVKLGNLFQLHARRPLPLDHLSPREQQIARALGDGKTFKSVARQYDIAVSTVANHASRIYRKLGVYRREDLVNLVRRPPGKTPIPTPPGDN